MPRTAKEQQFIRHLTQSDAFFMVPHGIVGRPSEDWYLISVKK